MENKSVMRATNGQGNRADSRQGSRTARRAFTLIELLVVIAIMAVLAAMLFPVLGVVKKHQYISMATGEMGRIASALDDYKAKYSVYPPSNPGNPVANQLYLELVGTTNINNTDPRNFQALDGSFTVNSSTWNAAFGSGVTALLNSSHYNSSSEDAAYAKNFIPGLKQNQIGTVNGVNVLITSVRGPDAQYRPAGVADVNPFRYVYPGVNNPNSYDLWVQLVIGGKTNLVCNWSKQVIVNSPLP